MSPFCGSGLSLFREEKLVAELWGCGREARLRGDVRAGGAGRFARHGGTSAAVGAGAGGGEPGVARAGVGSGPVEARPAPPAIRRGGTAAAVVAGGGGGGGGGCGHVATPAVNGMPRSRTGAHNPGTRRAATQWRTRPSRVAGRARPSGWRDSVHGDGTADGFDLNAGGWSTQ